MMQATSDGGPPPAVSGAYLRIMPCIHAAASASGAVVKQQKDTPECCLHTISPRDALVMPQLPVVSDSWT